MFVVRWERLERSGADRRDHDRLRRREVDVSLLLRSPRRRRHAGPLAVGAGRRTPLNFRELDGWVRPTWPGGDMQIHFEFLVPVGELDVQAARLVALGAEKSPHQDPDDPGLIVFLDPAGHPFCLFEDPF